MYINFQDDTFSIFGQQGFENWHLNLSENIKVMGGALWQMEAMIFFNGLIYRTKEIPQRELTC